MTRTLYNRLLNFALIGALGLWLLACTAQNEAPQTAAEDGDRTQEEAEMSEANESVPAVWPACEEGKARQTLSFVHVNDLHASYTMNPDDPQTGSLWAHLRGYFEAVRAENPYTLFTNGGDDHEKGSVVEQLSSGESTVAATRAMGFDVRVIGNHDFAYGREEFLRYTQDPRALVLASNTSFAGADKSPFGAKDFGLLRVGCVTVGFFGLTSEPWNELDQSYEGDFYPESDLHTRHDYAVRAKELVDTLRPQADIVVFVSHLGNSADLEIAAKVPGIDVILGGHSHTRLNEAQKVGDTLIVQAGSDGLFAARLDLTIDLARRKITDSRYVLKMNLADALPLSETVNAALADILRRYGAEAYQALGTLQSAQSKASLSPLAAQAVLHTLGADAVLLDSTTIWNGLSRGAVFAQDLLDAFKVEREPSATPGFNSYYTAEIDGAQLIRLAANYPKEGWTFLGPETIEAQATYTLALQKRVAFHPETYLGAGFTLGAPVARGEVWELLAAYAKARQAACRYVDSDESGMRCLLPKPE